VTNPDIEIVETQYFADEIIAYVMLEAVTILRTVGATETAEALSSVVGTMAEFLPDDGQVGFVISDGTFSRINEFNAAGGFGMIEAIMAQGDFQQALADEADALDGDDDVA